MARRTTQIDRRAIISRGLVGALAAVGTAATGLAIRGRKDVAEMAPTSPDVRAFGARGDGKSDDAPAIQRAIDAVASAGGGRVQFGPGTYLLRYRESQDGDGISALTMRSGVVLEGTDRDRCILRVADGQHGPGTYARTIASHGEISGATLRRFTIDGNRRGQGRFANDVSGGAVLLGWKGHCVNVIVEQLAVRDAVGQGIMILGSIGNVSRGIRIAGNLVERTAYIGIQCSQFDGVEIVGNEVNDCHDNGIDIYGDDTVGKSTVVTSYRATMIDNLINRCSIGIFFETVADCIAANNIIEDCRVAGVRVNRIHGEPRNLTIERNRILGTPIGIAMGGDTGGVLIRSNEILDFRTAAIEFSYNVSRVTAAENRFLPATRNTPIVLGRPTVLGSNPEEKLVDIRVTNNSVPRYHNANRRFVNGYRQTLNVDIGGFNAE